MKKERGEGKDRRRGKGKKDEYRVNGRQKHWTFPLHSTADNITHNTLEVVC
jgi:hypothetical protein